MGILKTSEAHLQQCASRQAKAAASLTKLGSHCSTRSEPRKAQGGQHGSQTDTDHHRNRAGLEDPQERVHSPLVPEVSLRGGCRGSGPSGGFGGLR